MRIGVIASVVLGLALSPGAMAQEKDPPTVSFDGPEVFAHVLHHFGLRPIAIDDIDEDPGDTLLIVFGDPEILKKVHNQPRGLTQFINRGGNLLIATDHPWQSVELGVGVRSGKIIQPDEAAYGRDGRCPWLPYVRPFEPGTGDPREHPIFRFLQKGLATNCPSSIRYDPNLVWFQPLLDFPIDARPGGVRKMPPFKPRLGSFTYIVGSPRDAPPEGRSLFVAGHGVFMNGMLLQSDNDNFAFSLNVVRWLGEAAGGGTRSKVLFIVDGQTINDFDMNLTPPVPPIPVPTVKTINRLIRGFEEEGRFHQILRELTGGNLRRTLGAVLVFMTLALLIYGMKKFVEGRYLRDSVVPVMVGVPTSPPSTKPIAEDQQKGVLRRTDFREPARLLVLDWFEREFGIARSSWAAGAKATMHASGFFWSRWKLERQASLLLRLIAESKDADLTRRGFFEVVQALRDLTVAVREARVRLLVDGKPVRHL